MKQVIKYLLKNSGMVFLIDLVFAMLGLVGLILSNWTGLQIAFGFIMVLSQILIYGMFGHSESFHGALFLGRKKPDMPKDVTEDSIHAKEFAVWKGFAAPAITEAIPFILLTLGLIIAPMRRGIQVFTGIWYSAFATLCNGFGADIASTGIHLLAVMYIPIVISIVSYGLGYLYGGLKKKKMNRYLDTDIASYDL